MAEEKKAPTLRDLFLRSVEVGLGAAALTRETAQKVVDELVAKGAVSRAEARETVSELLERGQRQKEQLDQYLAGVVSGVLEKADLARASQVRKLEARIAELEARLLRQAGPPA